jgi:hypothetical protein
VIPLADFLGTCASVNITGLGRVSGSYLCIFVIPLADFLGTCASVNITGLGRVSGSYLCIFVIPLADFLRKPVHLRDPPG